MTDSRSEARSEMSLTEVVAGRLRGQLAERRIKNMDVQNQTGWGKTTVWRKLQGLSPLDTDDFEKLDRLFGISPTQLLTGRPDDQPWPGPDGGGRKPSGW